MFSSDDVDLLDIDNCIRQMRHMDAKNADKIFGFIQRAYDIGLEYRRIWVSNS
ncbi:MAG: hypothetical protein ACPKPY_05080 [Nitrososphaeraceae archaeon]